MYWRRRGSGFAGNAGRKHEIDHGTGATSEPGCEAGQQERGDNQCLECAGAEQHQAQEAGPQSAVSGTSMPEKAGFLAADVADLRPEREGLPGGGRYCVDNA